MTGVSRFLLGCELSMPVTDAQAMSLLTPGVRKWVHRQGWPGFRDIQRASIGTLLSDDDRPDVVISAPTSSGKALTNDMPVLTTRGWVPIGDVKAGDMALSSDGRAYPVLGVYPQGKCDVYRLTMMDGRSVDCNIGHIWAVHDTEDDGVDSVSAVRTGEMIDNGVPSSDDDGVTFVHRYAIRRCEPLALSNDDGDVSLPIPPYAMGVLLGVMNGGHVWTDAWCGDWLDDAVQAAFVMDVDGRTADVRDGILGMGLNVHVSDMFVPRAYMEASIRQRKAFLGGFMDACGTCSNGTVTMPIRASHGLCDAMTDIARSLGIGVSRVHDGAEDTYVSTLSTDANPFMHAKDKVSAYDDMHAKHDASTGMDVIDSIAKTGATREMTCIMVASPDHTFVTRDFVITHNTEAALLPSFSIAEQSIADDPNDMRIRMLYVAPLKALINDQYRRACDIAECCGMDAYLWHTDAPQGIKNRLLKRHDGMLLTTPESLESFLMNRGGWCRKYLLPDVIILDEFHAFLGTGRGKQLMSLVSRVTELCYEAGRDKPTRIALSATLSDLDTVAEILSPDDGAMIIDAGAGGKDAELHVRCYPSKDHEGWSEPDYDAMSDAIIGLSDHGKTLTFCRSRTDVERVTSVINAHLDKMREDGAIDQRDDIEAFPHHGLMSKQARESLEQRLVSTDKPTMAIATQTLELGIDIGDIDRVLQVRNASSVASLRQRMGRSGRRNGRQRLDLLIPVDNDNASTQPDLVTAISEIELMRAGWFEPPSVRAKDASVLVSETMSMIMQYGSAYESELYDALCKYGAFRNVSEELFDLIVTDMTGKDLLQCMEDGTLLIGTAGEQLMRDWHFYAVFQDTEGYTVVHGSKPVGTIVPTPPMLDEMEQGMLTTFQLGGKKWRITLPIDYKHHAINVVPSNVGGVLSSGGKGPSTCGRILRSNISLLTGKASDYVPDYLDDCGRESLQRARDAARFLRLNPLGLSLALPVDTHSDVEREAMRQRGYTDDAVVRCVPPVDDATLNAILALLRIANATCDGNRNIASAMLDVNLAKITVSELAELSAEAVNVASAVKGHEETLIGDGLLGDIRGREKYNMYLSDETLRMAYADECMDVNGAVKWLKALNRFYDAPIQRRNGNASQSR